MVEVSQALRPDPEEGVLVEAFHTIPVRITIGTAAKVIESLDGFVCLRFAGCILDCWVPARCHALQLKEVAA